jgi:predicted XRE-type DNA-binding protein
MNNPRENDYLDEVAALRAEHEPEVAQNWSAIKLVSELRALRESKGLTQAQVAERMGIPQPHVARIERRPWGTGFARILAYAHAIGADLSVYDPERVAA